MKFFLSFVISVVLALKADASSRLAGFGSLYDSLAEQLVLHSPNQKQQPLPADTLRDLQTQLGSVKSQINGLIGKTQTAPIDLVAIDENLQELKSYFAVFKSTLLLLNTKNTEVKDLTEIATNVAVMDNKLKSATAENIDQGLEGIKTTVVNIQTHVKNVVLQNGVSEVQFRSNARAKPILGYVPPTVQAPPRDITEPDV